MSFIPEVNQTISLFGQTYEFPEHPSLPGMEIPYGQEGRQAIVYKIIEQGRANRQKALKVFRDRFKTSAQVRIAEKIKPFQDDLGLSAARRQVIDENNHPELVDDESDLCYSLIMPWIPGATWADLLLDQEKMEASESLKLAASLAYLLSELEKKGLAHGDLSSSNIMLPYVNNSELGDFYDIELIDIEDLYGPDLEQPDALPGGSPGYAPQYMSEGVWQAEADRFAGAVLIAEILSWQNPGLHDLKADDMHFFAPEELQKNLSKFKKTYKEIKNTAGRAAAELFEKAWKSRSLEECPDFASWFQAFPEAVQTAVINRANQVRKLKINTRDLTTDLDLSDHLEIAAAFEALGDRNAAESEYAFIVSHFPEQKSTLEEIKMLLPDTAAGAPDYEDYLNAAAHYERQENWQKAILFYRRIQSLPAAGKALQAEIPIIIEQLSKSIKRETPAENNSESLQPRREKHAALEQTQTPKKKNRVSFWRDFVKPAGRFLKRFWYIWSGALVVLLIAAGVYWYIQHKHEQIWQENIAQASSAYEQDNYQTAEDYLREAIAQKPTDDLYIKLATVYISDGKYDQAADQLTELLQKNEIDKSNQDVYYLIGRAYFLENQYGQAIDYYSKGLKKSDGTYPEDLKRDLVVSYAKTEQYDKANKIIGKLETSDPKSKAFAANLQGEIHEMQKKDQQAITDYQKAISLDENNQRYVDNLVDLYLVINKTNKISDQEKIDHYQEGIDLLNQLLSDNYTNVNDLNRLGQMYYNFGLLYENKGKAEKSRPLYEESISAYKQILDLGVQNEDIMINLGLLYGQIGNDKQAERTYKQIIKDYPENAHAVFVYALFELKTRDYEHAYALFKTVVKMDQNKSDTEIAKRRIKELEDKKLV